MLLVLALVAIVSVAARGSTSSGSGTSSPPGDTLLDTIFSLLLLLAVAWVAISLFSVVRWRGISTSVGPSNSILTARTIRIVAFAWTLAATGAEAAGTEMSAAARSGTMSTTPNAFGLDW